MSKVLGGDPVTYRKMPMSHLLHYMKLIKKDVEKRDIFLVPQAPIKF